MTAQHWGGTTVTAQGSSGLLPGRSAGQRELETEGGKTHGMKQNLQIGVLKLSQG